jgi:hypothetical protein
MDTAGKIVIFSCGCGTFIGGLIYVSGPKTKESREEALVIGTAFSTIPLTTISPWFLLFSLATWSIVFSLYPPPQYPRGTRVSTLTGVDG